MKCRGICPAGVCAAGTTLPATGRYCGEKLVRVLLPLAVTPRANRAW